MDGDNAAKQTVKTAYIMKALLFQKTMESRCEEAIKVLK